MKKGKKKVVTNVKTFSTTKKYIVSICKKKKTNTKVNRTFVEICSFIYQCNLKFD